MKIRFIAAVLLGLILMLGVGFAARADELATLTGRVTDAQGLVLPGVKVEAININTNVAYPGQTNNEGIYQIPSVPPGVYRVVLQKAGFSQVVKPGVELHVQDVITINFTMPVGSITQTVTVEAGASMINTTDASVSTVVDQSYVKNMPLNGRSFQDLILLTPGVVTQSPQSTISGTNLGANGEFSVNGQRTEANYYTVDGVSGNLGVTPGVIQGAGVSGSVAASTALGTTQALVSVDDLQEFRVSSSTYSAEYGRSPGGQFAFETKSGVNQWHGSGFDYLRNDNFAANDWFNNYLNVKQPALRQNDFGGTLGGPVTIPGAYNGKDKTFFFVSYEGLRLTAPQPAALNVFVPDVCLRGTGACPSPSGGAVSPAVTPVPSALQPALQAFPLANGPELMVPCAPFNPSGPTGDPTCPASGSENSGFAQFLGSWSNPSSLDSTSVRFDHVVNDKLKLFFRFSNTTSSSATRGGVLFSPSVVSFSETTTRTYTGGATSPFSSRLTNDVRLNYSTNETPFHYAISPIAGSSPANLPQLSGAPTGLVNLVICCNTVTELFQGPSSAYQEQWNLVDTVSLSLGRHQFKFGADYRRLTPHVVPFGPDVNYAFFSSSDLEANSATITNVVETSSAYPLYQNFSAFGQDEWRVTPRLTLSMGLRWEVNPPPGVTQGLMPFTAQGLSAPYDNTFAAPRGTPLYQTTWFNFAPRLGAAYVLRSSPGWETVVRAGGGVFYDTGNQNDSAGFNSVGFTSVNTLFGPAFPVDAPSSLKPIDQPCQNTTANPNNCPTYPLTAFYPHLQLPYTWQWNASLEQELGQSQALAVRFVGSHASRLIQDEGINLSGNPNVNPPIPPNLSLSQLSLVRNALTADYNSLQGQFTRRLSRGLTAMGSYTWSHCIDYGSYNFGETAQRGNCAFDIRHNFSGAFSYDLPNVGHNALLRALANHWGIDNRFTARTAFPIDLHGSEKPLANGQTYDSGLSLVPGQPVFLYGANCAAVLQDPNQIQELQPGQGCPGGKALNPNAFEQVLCPASDPTCKGNVPRNSLRLFGAWQMDLAVRREFPVFENLRLQFRAEAFNVFNHPNFGAVDGNCFGTDGVPGCFNGVFGIAQSTLANSLGILSPQYQMGGPRSMQFALRLVF